LEAESLSEDESQYDEFGYKVVQKRIYTEKELAAMQAIYP
jgi:hypothetical protein